MDAAMLHHVYGSLSPLHARLHGLLRQINRIRGRTDEPVRVCILGRFSTGKSRFIHALIGSDPLPFDTAECTAQIVELRGGDVDRATQLPDLDLDCGFEGEIPLSQFESAISLVGQTADQPFTPAIYRRYVASRLLRSVSLVDTPGNDGVHSSGLPMINLRDLVLHQSDGCLLVANYPGLHDTDVTLLDEIQAAQCPLVAVVLNKMDLHSEEDEISDTKAEVSSVLSHYRLHQTPVFACSAKWQLGSDAEHAFIECNSSPRRGWHEWDELLRYLGAFSVWGKIRRQILLTVDALAAAAEVETAYDRQLQASHEFLNRLAEMELKASTPTGRILIAQSRRRAENGQVLNWRRLSSLGIDVATLAPPTILPERELTAVLHALSALVVASIDYSLDTLDATILPALRGIVGTVIGLKCDADAAPALKVGRSAITEWTDAFDQTLRPRIAEFEWLCLPFVANFSYDVALVSLTARWDANPSLRRHDQEGALRRLRALIP